MMIILRQKQAHEKPFMRWIAPTSIIA